MRIVFNSWRDVDHPLAGGSELYVDRLAAGLTERGHDVALVVGRPVSEHPYEVVANGSRYSQYLRAPLVHGRRFRDADVVIDVANGMTYFAPLWRRGPNVILLHHIHEGQWEQWFPQPTAAVGSFLERRGIPFVYRKSLFVTVSESTAASLVGLGVDRDRIRIVPNGIDSVASTGTESVGPTYVSLARLVPHKRVPLAVEAWREVQERVAGRLLILGDGPDAELVERMGVDRVEVLGRVSDEERDRLLGACSFLVHPSMLEGWGLVVMEAAAQGKPTLAFDVPGLRDSVVNGVTGVLAEDFDDFVQQWITLGTNPEIRRRMGLAARERAGMFSWDRSVKEFEDVLLEACARSQRGPLRGRRRKAIPLIGPEQSAHTPPVDADADAVRPGADESAGADVSAGVPSSWELLKLFRSEKHDPGPFYQRLAERSVAKFPLPVDGRRLLDLGCGHGEYAREFIARGAKVTAVDFDDWLVPEVRPSAVLADATQLPFADGSFDIVFCSNLLEHTPDPDWVFDEIARVLTLGGMAWVSWTNWYSPWGGHEIVPLHYLGPRAGLRVWRGLFGEPRKNVPFDALWPTYVGDMLQRAEAHAQLELVDAVPRYYPSQRWILSVPILREVATWNCAMTLERTARPA